MLVQKQSGTGICLPLFPGGKDFSFHWEVASFPVCSCPVLWLVLWPMGVLSSPVIASASAWLLSLTPHTCCTYIGRVHWSCLTWPCRRVLWSSSRRDGSLPVLWDPAWRFDACQPHGPRHQRKAATAAPSRKSQQTAGGWMCSRRSPWVALAGLSLSPSLWRNCRAALRPWVAGRWVPGPGQIAQGNGGGPWGCREASWALHGPSPLPHWGWAMLVVVLVDCGPCHPGAGSSISWWMKGIEGLDFLQQNKVLQLKMIPAILLRILWFYFFQKHEKSICNYAK